MYWDKAKEVFVGVSEKAGNICPYHILENPRSRNAAGLYAIRQDLIETHQAIQYLIDNPDAPPIIKKNLLFSAVVQYAKAYTASKNRWAQLDANEVFKGQPPGALQFHNDTMEIRNQYLAHAGDSPHESRVMVALLNPDLENKGIETIFYNSFKLMNDDFNLKHYKAMVEIAINHVENRIQEGKAQHDDEVKAIGLDKLYAESTTPTEPDFVEIPNLKH